MQLKPLALSFLLLSVLQSPAQAQITPANDGTNTTVSNTLNITGGTPSGNNLFHSFQTFGVNAGQTATFQSNPAIQNILGRVIGGDPSVINGTLQVIGGNSNLYLINPAGIIFGQGASLNVPGSFTATTANAIGFGDGKWFNAVGANNYSALVGNPGEFAFTNQPGSIFNSANLTQKEGQSIALVGGTVVSTGTIAAPGGKITIATVPGNQLVRISDSGSVLSLDLPIANQRQINALPFTPLSLPALLTGRSANEAAGVTIENGVVKLTGSGQAIASGDIVTKVIDSSTDGARGGDVTLLGAGDIQVDSINTSTRNFGEVGQGGSVDIKATGLFRAIGFISSSVPNSSVVNQNSEAIVNSSGTSIFTGGNTKEFGADERFGGGRISITHGGTSFVSGGQTQLSTVDLGLTITLNQGFTFPNNASGTVGAIISRNSNGNYRVVFQDGAFKSFPDNIASGFSITAVPRPSRPDPSRPDPQTVQRQFTRTAGDQCGTNSTTVASNNPAPQRGTTTSTNPCPSSSTEGNILQVVDK
jgi:filamentous hemagglutinin family protein